jgi:Domain of unknown function (DUF4824)
MKRTSLITAAAIVLIANAFALIHARNNRSGSVETDITLTERELPVSYNSNDEDSGVSLDLRWTSPGWRTWLDQKKLQEIGFDTTVGPSDDKAPEFYRRQRSRRAFVALEFDGPAWRQHLDDVQRQIRERPELAQSYLPANLESESRLIVMDASDDALRLRARHPNRNTVVIIPAMVGIVLDAGQKLPWKPAQLTGSIQEVPTSIHVPRPFADSFERLPRGRRAAKYQVHLRFGPSFEPWIVGVEFPPSAR